MIEKMLRLGFIGGGINSAVGNSHRIASQMDGRWLVTAGCFSKNSDINKRTAETWNIGRCYDRWIDLLETEKNNLDAVVILTPTDIHFEMIEKALMLGFPVISEKALVPTREEAVVIATYALQNKSFLAVINNYTGYPMLRELSWMIKNNMLGLIRHIQIEMPQEGFIRYIKNNEKPRPQGWRLRDGIIPTIYLDLGVHLHQIIYFLCGEKPIEVNAVQSSCGFFENIVDNVSCLAKYSGNTTCQLWFSKSALGNRNGLRVRLYGELGSAEWYQMEPEMLKYCAKDGKLSVIDTAAPDVRIANEPRYNRFKAGHPTGFLEAFANYYYDLADGLHEFKKTGECTNPWLVYSDTASEGLKMLNAMAESAKSGVSQMVK